MSISNLKRLTLDLIVKGVCALPPKRVLRFLFRLERWLYYLQGQVAGAYGDGIHPKHRLMRYHDFFVGRISHGERALDVGCGIGAVAYDVAEKSGAHVMGIDLDSDSIAQARRRHAHPSVEYRVGDVLRKLPTEPFDVIILSNVLEHLPERSAFLRQLQRQYNPSRILIRVPLVERDWRVPLKRELGMEWRLDPTHETEYTLESFAEEVAVAGLCISHQEIHWSEIWAEVTAEGGETTSGVN
jgi:ubiquinone/menaquinone biosynthesis C-methylase UbiE